MGIYSREVATLYQQKTSEENKYLYLFDNFVWLVSKDYTSSTSGLRNMDVTHCPEDVASGWEHYSGPVEKWKTAIGATIRCSDCNKYPNNMECGKLVY